MRFLRFDVGRRMADGGSCGGVLAGSAAALRRLPSALSGARLSAAILALAPCSLFVAAIYATPPAWWAERGVTSAQPADDYAAANQGQLKHIAAQAAAEMDARLPGGAGATISNLIAAWRAAPASGVTRDDYAAVNLGQLKTVAKPFYDRLAAASYTGQPLAAGQVYPWSNSTTPADDYALANLGQVKYIFSFDLSGFTADVDSDDDDVTDEEEAVLGTNPQLADTDGDGLSDGDEVARGTNPLSTDTDNDGLPDAWEVAHGTAPTTSDASADPDGDGLTNAQEYAAGTEPTAADTDGDDILDTQELADGTSPTDYYNGQTPILTSVSGTGQSGPPGYFLLSPWVVKVTDAAGAPLVNAPVTFTASGATVGFSTSYDGSQPVTTPLTVRSDEAGIVRVFWKL